MDEIRKIVGKNISTLRKNIKLTQLELAEALNYSDKAVSKWECGDSLPDVEILVEVAQFFNVTLDYLVSAEHDKVEKKSIKEPKRYTHNKMMITSLAVIAVVMLAVIAYICLESAGLSNIAWTTFVYAMPLAFIVLLIFNCIWGRKVLRFVYISLLAWSLLLSAYIIFLEYHFWMIFIVGIPIQVAIMFWSQIRKS